MARYRPALSVYGGSNKDAQKYDCPVDHCAMPSLVSLQVARVVQDDKGLDNCGAKIRWRRGSELPPPESDPTEDPADDAAIFLESELSCPSILRRRCW